MNRIWNHINLKLMLLSYHRKQSSKKHYPRQQVNLINHWWICQIITKSKYKMKRKIVRNNLKDIKRCKTNWMSFLWLMIKWNRTQSKCLEIRYKAYLNDLKRPINKLIVQEIMFSKAKNSWIGINLSLFKRHKNFNKNYQKNNKLFRTSRNSFNSI